MQKQPAIERVLYPGLESHPDFALATDQLKDAGAIISCDLKGGEKARDRFIAGLKLIQLTASLGCTESVVAPSAFFYGGGFTPQEQESAGLLGGTVRLSIGIEDADDLISDLESALNQL